MRNLYIFLAHIDDFECSCYGYLFKHHKEYKKINLIVTTNWEQKKSIMLQNLKDLPNFSLEKETVCRFGKKRLFVLFLA